MTHPGRVTEVEARARALFDDRFRGNTRWTDRFFAGLLIVQWATAVGVALWISPLAWEGDESRVHPHVWGAMGLGGIIALPAVLGWLRSSEPSTRYALAIGQLLMGSLLIHQTGGRIETHFHIFGSLALLAFYRDWKVMVVATVVVAADHLLRGTFWPRSVFGVAVANPWRWIEHAGWVVFEDVFLIRSCFRSVAEMQDVAWNRAELEVTRARVEATVKERTEDLRRGELRYRSLVESTSSIVWRTPESGRFESEQPGWSGFTGQSFEQLEGWGGLDAVHPDDRGRTARAWSAAVAGRTLYEVEHRVRRHDGQYRHMLGRAVPILDERGAISEWFGIHSDVDLQTRAHEAMSQAREAAEAACRAKSEFLANMSHEIRTPMNGIIGMTELALDTELSDQQREYLGLVKSSSDALLNVINDILDFSKIEAGKLDLDPIPFDLRDCVEETLKILALRAHAKGLELSGRIAPDVPDGVIGDAGRLRQVLVNLVGNAIKFTAEGEVAVSVELVGAPSPDGELALRVSVRDTGIGIPRGKLRSIFEPFEQADGSTTRKYGGTGLGLAISVKLVQLMGGKLSVESELDCGSTFHFVATLGLQPGGASGRNRANPEALRGMPILVVDDNFTNRRILEEVVASWGARPTVVGGGRVALRALEEARAAGQPFRVILLDGMMPDMDGYAVAQRIRANPNLAGPLIVMLTSNDGSGESSRCLALGISERLTKPVRQSDLLEVLLKLLPAGESPAAVEPAPPEGSRTPDERSYAILLAEDHAVNQKVVTRMLEKRGCRVTVASDGRQALTALARARFDLVLMDIQMPEMDGFEALAAIRREEQSTGPHRPVIALTAHAMKGDRDRCLAAGFDAYVPKPIRSEMLFAAIDQLFARAPAGPSTDEPPAVAPAVAFDRRFALESAGGDESLLQELLDLFFHDCPAQLDAIESAIEADDVPSMRRAAHKIKGAASNFAATGVVDAAARLEDAGSCRSGESEVAGLVAALDDFFRAVGGLATSTPPWQTAPAISSGGPDYPGD